MSVLEIKNYTKCYAEGKKACDNVNLSVESGDIFAFIGHNGAGKSTTIRAVVGVMEFDEGEIYIDRHSVAMSVVAAVLSLLSYKAVKKFAQKGLA